MLNSSFIIPSCAGDATAIGILHEWPAPRHYDWLVLVGALIMASPVKRGTPVVLFNKSNQC
jgi:hypothetical protein